MRINYANTWPPVVGQGHANELASRFLANKEGINLSLQFRGTWSALIAYDLNDVVVHNAIDYRAVIASTGVTPGADLTKWKPFGNNDLSALLSKAHAILGWFYSSSFRYISVTRNVSGDIESAQIAWPDGATGVFTIISRNANNDILSYSATHVLGGTTTTYTQPTMTYDDFGVSVQPAVVIS